MPGEATHMVSPINVLVSLHRGYGLGDAVSMSAVLRHVKKYRPHWLFDYQAEEGHHQVGRGIAHNTFAWGQVRESPLYDAEVQITLFDKWHGFTDRPNTQVSVCLKQHFNLDWDDECGRYEVAVSASAHRSAQEYMHHVTSEYTRPYRMSRCVGIHTEGRTAKSMKDLTPIQDEQICDAIRRAGCMPFSFKNYSGNVEANCALIRQCEAFVGIDSGPAKCASATDTPTLVVWTGHHPAQFHDPAPNTTHLVPTNYHELHPVRGNEKVIMWFLANYKVRHYHIDPIPEIQQWLQETLK